MRIPGCFCFVRFLEVSLFVLVYRFFYGGCFNDCSRFSFVFRGFRGCSHFSFNLRGVSVVALAFRSFYQDAFVSFVWAFSLILFWCIR